MFTRYSGSTDLPAEQKLEGKALQLKAEDIPPIKPSPLYDEDGSISELPELKILSLDDLKRVVRELLTTVYS